MSQDIALTVNGLSKSYVIQHQATKSPVTIRGSLRGRLKGLIGRKDNRKTSETFWALKDVSFDVKRGEVIGIIGKNGSGKSTLLKVLSRITEPTRGFADVYGSVGSLLEVGTGFHPELTGRENIFLNGTLLGMRRAAISKVFDQIVEFAGIERFLDTPVKRYSSGMYVRLAFSIAAYIDPDILIVDEVLAVGDADFQRRCLGRMESAASSGRTIIFVSHNMTTVQSLCSKVCLLEGGKVSYLGSVSEGVNRYLDSQVRAASLDLSTREDRQGNGKLRFTKVEVIDVDGREVSHLISGGTFTIRIHYTSSERKQEGLKVAFNVINSQDYTLVNFCTSDTCLTPLEIASCGVFECVFENFPLRSGTYRCNLFCSSHAGILDWVTSAFTLLVEDGDFFSTGKIPPREQGDFLISHFWKAGQK
jgi:lipopolysaccharide transport system ATP-binding protein